MKLIRDHVDGVEEQEKAVIDVQIKANYIQEFVNNASSCADIMYNLGNQIEKLFGDNINLCKEALSAWKDGINMTPKETKFI